MKEVTKEQVAMKRFRMMGRFNHISNVVDKEITVAGNRYKAFFVYDRIDIYQIFEGNEVGIKIETL